MTRTFDGLRKRDKDVISPDDVALARLLATPEGEQILRLLKKRTDRVVSSDASSGAFVAINAERSFTAQLERLFAHGRGLDVERARATLWGYPESDAGSRRT